MAASESERLGWAREFEKIVAGKGVEAVLVEPPPSFAGVRLEEGQQPRERGDRRRSTMTNSNDWSGIDGGTLSFIYHSIEPSDFTAPTARLWEPILDELGAELDRRCDAWHAEFNPTAPQPELVMDRTEA